jgi:cellulose synthase/poly-beta-1,6-N-acetylglucosamine synthase-like glycosyltransferase
MPIPPPPAAVKPIQESDWQPVLDSILTLSTGLLLVGATYRVVDDQFPILLRQIADGDYRGAAGHLLFLFIVAIMLSGSVMYHLSRWGYVRRRARFQQVPAADLQALAVGDVPRLTVLVPSYNEEEKVMWQTLVSAALQAVPGRRIVLLIDNSPVPAEREDRQMLETARRMPAAVTAWLASGARCVSKAQAAGLSPQEAWAACAEWFEAQASAYPVTDHTDRFFVDFILLDRAQTARRHAAGVDLPADSWTEMRAWFDADIAGFERKTWENLSHAPNKAMNLNSYIGLMGGTFIAEEREDGRHAVRVGAERAGEPGAFTVPEPEFVLTLDADSLLLPEYARKLLVHMRQEGNSRCAVAQTPYSALPGPPGTLERIAGATTDIQYILHQGFTHFGATYWVGANALLRKSALDDIATTTVERGHSVPVFVQDRTVIEDTESTIDLVSRGWTLFNHPERLAYSATPPDFGSLIIQRRRWANGGLLIAPAAFRYLARSRRPLTEAFLRLHYLLSIAGVNIGLVLVLAVPLSRSVETNWLPVTAIPYFTLYLRDLLLCGYRPGDLFRVYALQLLLIPVHLGGVLKSLQQARTGAKIPFGRTPKVVGRTAAVAPYMFWVYALIAQWLFGAFWDAYNGYPNLGLFAAANSLILFYALVVFVGLRESIEDF